MRTLKISFLVFILSISISAQNFWQQTNGPYSGAAVNDFLQYDDSTIFLATDEGIIRSLDNGETWSRINGQYLDAKIRCIAKDHFGVLYASNTIFSPGLFRSTDQGNTWQFINYNYAADITYIFIPYKDTIMLGTSDMGIIRTYNGGTTWNQVNNGLEYLGVYKIILITDGSILVGSMGGGVYKSTNWGDLWIASNNGLPANSQGRRYARSFCEINPGQILIGTPFGIYYSSDYGVTWINKNNGLTEITASSIVKDTNNYIYAGIVFGGGVYRSTNGGDYWYHLGLGLTINALGWDTESRLYACSSSLGLFRFIIEDSTWFQVYNQSYVPVEVDNLWVTDGGNIIAATPWWGLQYTTNSGENWKRLNAPATFYDMVTINDSIFIGSGGTVYVSNDTGSTWTATSNFNSYASFYEPITQTVYLGGYDEINDIWGIYTSIDFGQSWTLLADFPRIAYVQTVLDIYVTRNQQVILTTFRYTFYPNGQFSRFYKSTDHGQTWELILENQIDYITHIIEDAYSNLYALVDTKLLVSEDEGKTWITRTIPGSDIIASDHSGRIYRNAGIGVQYSTDKGITWITVDNSGLNNWVNEMTINQHNRIYLATTSGIYIGEADSIVLSTENIEPIKSFYLSQNYPNPFNPSTNLQYAIGSSQFVTLKVYDLLGREIATLVNEEKPAGEYEVEFNAASHSGEVRNLPSGIYFYQLKAGEFTETRKMVLLK